MAEGYRSYEQEEPVREEVLESTLYSFYRGAMICKISMDAIDNVFSKNISAWDDYCSHMLSLMSMSNEKISLLHAWAENNRSLEWYEPRTSELEELYILGLDLQNIFCKVVRSYKDLRNQENQLIISFEDQQKNMGIAQQGIDLMRSAVSEYMDLMEGKE